MTAHEQRAAAEKFAQQWLGKGNEKSDTQQFWTSLLRDVFGVEKPEETVEFERPVQLGHVSFIDVYIPKTKVLIEQKKLEVDLLKPIKQSDGTSLTPYEQAKRYSDNMSYSERPRWIITCNFQSFNIHDMNRPHDAPTNVALANLGKEYHRLQLLVDPNHGGPGGETEVSVKAGELVGVLYDLLVKEYKDPTNPLSLRSLNILCVRLVFCLYAEDAGIFGKRDMFHDYMAQFNAASFRTALIELFKILNTPLEKRDPYLRPDLAEFPYVNGGLFADEDIEIPNFTEEIRKVTLNKASKDFDWSRISPTIFGAVFESTLNPETRKSGGMHYTSIENIHKVVDPLFLDELRQELSVIQGITAYKDQRKAAQKFQQKLATLKFLDPACGSGNFLTETYLSIRRLENDAIYIINREQGVFGEVDNPIKVSIDQFYGIEINDFAVSVARTALWIAESQMKEETNRLAHTDADFLPLKTNAHIVEGNALTLDWNELCPKEELSFIMGNPPFVGYSNQNEAQKLETRTIFTDENGKEYKNAGKIDYVANWYFKACQYMQGTQICAAFVSTNSVTQGDQVAAIWKPLYKRFGVDIIFAYRTFRWDSEANLKAHVHCVIIGFTVSRMLGNVVKKLFLLDSMQIVGNINPYLIDAPNILIENRKETISEAPNMSWGNKPTEGGFLFLSVEERTLILQKEPQIAPFIKKAIGAEEYINKIDRYCLWLVGVTPQVIKGSKFISERIALVKEYRSQSVKASTRKDAETPWLFQEIRQPISNYIIIPVVSSEKRKYIPIGFMTPDIIVLASAQAIPDATLYHFGVLTSSVHMAWMRAVCGRLKSDYRYSKDIVYNNFIWPEALEEQRAAIEQTAQGILDARAQFPASSLADLYDETTMPPELRRAHEANDKAVLKAYGFSPKATEEEIVAALMKLYSERTTMTKENEGEPRERKQPEKKRERPDKERENCPSETTAAEDHAREKSSANVADFASIGIINHIIDHSAKPSDEEYEEGLKKELERFRRMKEENPNSRGSGLAEVLALLGDLHAKQGKFYEAEREYLEAEDAYNKLASFATFEYYAEIARIMSARADIYFEVQEWKAAENTYNDSLRLYNVLMAPTPYGYGAGYAHTLVNLSKLYKVTNRFDEAEKGYREVIELYRAFLARFPNEFDAKLATTLNSLACLLFEKRQYDESEKAFEEAISILRRLEDTDENANSLANALNGLGNVYADQNSPFLAEQKYAETVDIYRSLIAKGLDDWDYDLMLANTLRHLASQRVKLARDEEAEENYLEALAIAQEDNVGEYAFFIAETSFELAMFYAERGRFADAEAKFADALAILRRINAAQPGCCMLDLAFALVNLSGCRHRLGRHAEAKQGLQEALEIYRAFEKDCPSQFTGIIEDATRLLNEVCKQMNVE